MRMIKKTGNYILDEHDGVFMITMFFNGNAESRVFDSIDEAEIFISEYLTA